MKTPEQIYKETFCFMSAPPLTEIQKHFALIAIEQAQKEAWNSALDWAMEHALLKIESKEIPSSHITQFNGYIDDGSEMCITVSKESILKGKL